MTQHDRAYPEFDGFLLPQVACQMLLSHPNCLIKALLQGYKG